MKIDNWFTGIIEDCDTTNKRVRVRMFGLHSFEVDSNGSAEILTSDLPWATLLLPVTVLLTNSSSISSLIGRCAFGFFRDSADMQDAVVIGVYEGEWNQTKNAAYNPIFNQTGYSNSMPPANSYAGPINVGSNSIGVSAGGGYIPFTAAHGSGLLKEFNQTLPGNSYNQTIANRIIQPAFSQLSRNVTYATNPGAISEYFKATNYPTGAASREPWCAAFVCWCIQQSGLFDENSRPKNADAFGFDNWARQSNVSSRVALEYNPRDVKPGDIVVFSWSHVGIVTKSTPGESTFQTIDGNTAGGKIAQRNRQLSSVKFVVRVVS
jgi:hypothetical protein